MSKKECCLYAVVVALLLVIVVPLGLDALYEAGRKIRYLVDSTETVRQVDHQMRDPWQ